MAGACRLASCNRGNRSVRPPLFRGRPVGQLQRHYQTLKRNVNRLPYELPSDLEVAIVAFVSYYNSGAITRPWAK